MHRTFGYYPEPRTIGAKGVEIEILNAGEGVSPSRLRGLESVVDSPSGPKMEFGEMYARKVHLRIRISVFFVRRNNKEKA